MISFKHLKRLASMLALSTACLAAYAQKTYNVAAFSDFSGPYASVFSELIQAREATLAWWNAEVGTKIGVKIVLRQYDNRYDTAQTASIWPGVKAELNPILIFGVGGPDVAALQTRLPDDKVPMVLGTAAYGYAWKPEPWVFNPRPTLAHEMAAFLEWKYKSQNRPVRFALISSEASPGYADFSKGLTTFAKDNKNVEFVEILNTEMQPTDLTLQVRRMANAKVDVILVPGNTAQAVAAKRALQSLNLKVPLMYSTYNGFQLSAKALGGTALFEGDYEVCACTVTADEDSSAKRFYEMLKKDHGLKTNWNGFTALGIGQTLYTMRALERAVAKVGPDKLTGLAIRDALLSGPTTSAQTFGYYPALAFTNDAPFPQTGLLATIATFKDGKSVLVGREVPVPRIAKW